MSSQELYIKGRLLRFSGSYFAVIIKTSWALKKEEIVNITIWVFFISFVNIVLEIYVFCNYVVLRRHILNISKTVFMKLIFHLQRSDELSDVVLQGFHINSTYVIDLWI